MNVINFAQPRQGAMELNSPHESGTYGAHITLCGHRQQFPPLMRMRSGGPGQNGVCKMQSQDFAHVIGKSSASAAHNVRAQMPKSTHITPKRIVPIPDMSSIETVPRIIYAPDVSCYCLQKPGVNTTSNVMSSNRPSNIAMVHNQVCKSVRAA